MYPQKVYRRTTSIMRGTGRLSLAKLFTLLITAVVVVLLFVGKALLLENTKRMTEAFDRLYSAEHQEEPNSMFHEVQRDMSARRKIMEDSCARNIGNLDKKTPKKAFYVQPYDFYVCLVAKIASTFWSRFLYQLQNTHPVESPFDVRVNAAYDSLSAVNTEHFPDLKATNVTTKLVFVREPFGRLFSAYVDKLLPPNPIFWKQWGQRAILEFRPNRPTSEFVYGNDTTFSEFISFATKRGSGYDVHLVPIYNVCNPCKVKFNAIGKMESFERDAKYVVSRLGIPVQQIGFDRMKADQEEDALTDSTGGSFSPEWLRSITRIISLEACAQRIWRKLQIRGFISWRQKFRLTPYQKEHLNMTELVHMLKEAKLASTNETELKIQKKQAFLEAYSTLKPHQIQEITTVYGPDFDVFGYDKELVNKTLQSHPDLKNTDSLDWSKDWDLSPVLE